MSFDRRFELPLFEEEVFVCTEQDCEKCTFDCSADNDDIGDEED